MTEQSRPSQGQHDPVTWFTESQRQTVIRNGIVPEWFHGVISRNTAEALLMAKPPGYFLIRVSETRAGYSLSYRAGDRCRHFMIDALGGSNYIIVGEKRRHRSLQDLVDFHRRSPVLPFTDVLTVACGQSNDQADYAELLFPKKPNSSLDLYSLLQQNMSAPGSEETITPPALPCRPGKIQNVTVPVPSSQPNLLYPCLQFSHFPSQPPARIHTAEEPLYTLPYDVHPQSCVPLQNQACISTVAVCEGSPSPKFNQQPPIQPGKDPCMRPSVVNNLKNLKKKFQKKSNKSDEPMYADINVDMPDMVLCGDLPPEYLPPPPFAPGH